MEEKSDLENKIKISMLCEFYGALLTKKQYEFLNDYYNNDLSLSEIAKIQKDYSDEKIANILESIKKELRYLV